MLANGIKLGYKASHGAPSYTDLKGLKEVPEMGADPENIDNTCLADKNKQYEQGIGDLGEMSYKFKFENTEGSTYRLMRALANTKTPTEFEQLLPDGTKFQYTAIPSIKLGGGGVNGVIDFTLNMTVQSDITVVDPD